MATCKIYFSKSNHKDTLAKLINKALGENKTVEIYPADSEAFKKVGTTMAKLGKQCTFEIEEGKTKYVIAPSNKTREG